MIVIYDKPSDVACVAHTHTRCWQPHRGNDKIRRLVVVLVVAVDGGGGARQINRLPFKPQKQYRPVRTFHVARG